jgi:hypothetical protein
MTTDRIGYRPSPTYYDFPEMHSPEIHSYDPNKFISKKLQKQYYSDTIAPFIAPVVNAPNAPDLNNPLNTIGSRPRIEEPEFDNKKLEGFFSQKVNHHLIHEVQKKESGEQTKNLNEGESLLLSLLIDCYKMEKSHAEDKNLIDFGLIKNKQAAKQKLGQEYFSLRDKFIDRLKTSEKLGWADWILSGAVLIGGLASLAITWGASASAVFTSWLTLGNAIGGIGAGGVKIIQGIYNHNSNALQGEIKELEFLRELHGEKINISMEEMKRSMEAVAEIMQQMIEVLYNLQQAASSMKQ